MRNVSLIRWLTGCLIFFNACNADKGAPVPKTPVYADQPPPPVLLGRIRQSLDSLKKLVRPGDVITRTAMTSPAKVFVRSTGVIRLSRIAGSRASSTTAFLYIMLSAANGIRTKRLKEKTLKGLQILQITAQPVFFGLISHRR